MGQDGGEHRPFLIHRALLGSLERFFGVLIEHYAGAFPLWLSPVQVRIMPITDEQNPYCAEIKNRLQKESFRVELDERNEKINYKIREAEVQKIPYMTVVGDKEVENKTISVREKSSQKQSSQKLSDFIKNIKQEIVAKR